MAIVEEAVAAVVLEVDPIEVVLSTGTAKPVKRMFTFHSQKDAFLIIVFSATLKRRFTSLGEVKMATPNSRPRRLLPLMLRQRPPTTIGVPPLQTTGIPPPPTNGVLLQLLPTRNGGPLPSPPPMPGVPQIPLRAIPSSNKPVAAGIKSLKKRIIP